MYTLVSAIGVLKAPGSRWTNLSIGNVPVYQLFTTYRKVYITLSNVFLDNPIVADLESLRLNYSAFTGTFNSLLTSLGNTTIPAVSQPPVLNPKYAQYSDAFRAGYKIQTVNLSMTNNNNLLPSEKTSLKISRPNPETDMSLVYNSCLLSVNGFLHRLDYDGTYAYGIEAASSMLKSHKNLVGLLSFRELGAVQTVPITDSMIFKQSLLIGLKDRIYVKLNQDVSNKTVILSLGGYLVFVDGSSLWQSGESTFAINIAALPFVERYFESKPFINFDSLDLPVSTDNPDLVNISELLSDTVLTKFLKLPQTFFCIINTPQIFTNRVAIKKTGIPTKYTSFTEPKYPMIVGNGKIAEYWKVYEDGQWAISAANSFINDKVFSSVPESQLNNVGNANIPGSKHSNSEAYLLEIGKDF